MQTNFTPDQLSNSALATSEKILRSCVHCGFCTATCPTYVLLGDELDSPRGRIYQIKDMFESDRAADEKIVKHLDRCLSCLSCMTTCPSGVHYMHLVDHARAHVEQTYTRPLPDRFMRGLLSAILPYPNRFRAALALGKIGSLLLKIHRLFSVKANVAAVGFKKALLPVAGGMGLLHRSIAMLELTPKTLPTRSSFDNAGSYKPQGAVKGRVILLQGCAQRVLSPSINEAAIKLLNRLGYEVLLIKDEGCCGALVHHMGDTHTSHQQAAHNMKLWLKEADQGLDAIIITASGCGTTIKDYGFMFRDDAELAQNAATISALAKDISEFLVDLDLSPTCATGQVVAYHSACSLQHGQKVTEAPKAILRRLGYSVKDVPEAHLCCGSAGTYNIMQPEISAALRERKVQNIRKTRPDMVVAGNIGCLTQIRKGLEEDGQTIPILHLVELVNYATGGERPEALNV